MMYFVLLKAWLRHEEYLNLNEASSLSYINIHIPQSTGRGGGVAAIFDSSLLYKP